MAFFNRFPFTTYNDINLDWIIRNVKQLISKVEELDTGSAGELDERVTQAEADIDQLQEEVETPTTGLLDRMTEAELELDNLSEQVSDVQEIYWIDIATIDADKVAEAVAAKDAGKLVCCSYLGSVYVLSYSLGSMLTLANVSAAGNVYVEFLDIVDYEPYYILRDPIALASDMIVTTVISPGSTDVVTGGGIYNALQAKQDTLTFDDAPTDGSTNPVTSDGIADALAAKQDTLTFDTAPTDGSTNPVTSEGIYDALQDKQDTLTFDAAPTSGSTNPVTSDGVYQAIQDASFSGATFDGTPTEGSTNPVTSDGIYQAIVDEIVTDTFLLSGASGATIPAESSTIFTEDISRNGYTPIGFIGYTVVGTDSEKLYINRLYISAGEALVRIYNPASAGITLTNVRIWVLYKKEV